MSRGIILGYLTLLLSALNVNGQVPGDTSLFLLEHLGPNEVANLSESQKDSLAKQIAFYSSPYVRVLGIKGFVHLRQHVVRKKNFILNMNNKDSMHLVKGEFLPSSFDGERRLIGRTFWSVDSNAQIGEFGINRNEVNLPYEFSSTYWKYPIQDPEYSAAIGAIYIGDNVWALMWSTLLRVNDDPEGEKICFDAGDVPGAPQLERPSLLRGTFNICYYPDAHYGADLYDLNGKLVHNLIPFGFYTKGYHDFHNQADNLRPGVYIARSVVDGKVYAEKLLILK